jgi:tRNA threonylcarbamoyladenosine biosynthesis protein TsaE
MMAEQNKAVRLLSRSAEETERIGYDIGCTLKARKGGATVLLHGDLGAGKTTLVRGIASALGIPDREVCSASFTLVVEYDTSPPLHHVDLYRLSSDAEVDDLGIWEYVDAGGVTVIEWAEKLRYAPPDAITVTLSYRGEHEREIEIEGMPESTVGTNARGERAA